MIAIIDYKAGNIGSVKNALNWLGVESLVTNQTEQISSADAVIFPGQGRAGSSMHNLRENGLDRLIPTLTQPFLGICLGMQLLADSSDEDKTDCLGVVPGRCRRFPNNLKQPQIGWNSVSLVKNSPLTDGLKDHEYFYFVNSYYFDAEPSCIVGTTAYGFDFASIVQKDNFFAVQFHPEKSDKAGQKMLQNFCQIAAIDTAISHYSAATVSPNSPPTGIATADANAANNIDDNAFASTHNNSCNSGNSCNSSDDSEAKTCL